MTTTSLKARSKKPWVDFFLLQLAVPLVFMVIVMFFFTSRTRFEFSTDEGINLMKAMLVERGYPLYGEIWSDQPPLFTYLIAGVIHFVGYKVGAARFTVLLLSCILLWAAFQYMRLVWGTKTALAGALLIFMLPKYMVLSVSVMVGLPALTFAMVSLLAVTLWHLRRKPIWLVFSAVALAISILIKLLTGFLGVIFVVGILVGEYYRYRGERAWRKVLGPPLLWMAVFSIVAVGVGILLVDPANIPQLLETHLLAENVGRFQNDVMLTINWYIKYIWPFLVLGIIGAFFSLQAKRWLALYPLAWMVTAYLLLYFHTPVWEHHQLLLTIPAAILGASAFVEAVGMLLRIIQSHYHLSTSGVLRVTALLGIAALFLTFRLQEPISLLRIKPEISAPELELGPNPEAILNKVFLFAPKTNWVVTDMPMYAFRAGLPVPPNLAVFSWKRVETGNLTETEVVKTVKEYLPEQVLLGRFEFPLLDQFLNDHYRLVERDDYLRFYVRNDLQKSNP